MIISYNAVNIFLYDSLIRGAKNRSRFPADMQTTLPNLCYIIVQGLRCHVAIRLIRV